MAFQLLSEPIRKYIRDKGWEQLRPIQTAAITRILASDENYILASRTASGKTEAAFLPILSKIDFKESGVQVLYVSPLIALINDQFYRIEELCQNLDISVTKWHGEANKTQKGKLLKQPNGIVLITPESLEAMFVNKPYFVMQLFSNLKYVVIDEIHSFIGTDRGVQLKSILARLQKINNQSFSIIGLSATIGDYNEAKDFTGDSSKTKVLLDRTSKEIQVMFRYFKGEGDELPLDLLKDLYVETKDNKVLIFPNSRGRAEEVAVKLKKISDRVKGHPYYFSHHSSVDKEVREYIEYFAKNNYRLNFCIACTSTLELGIDIGSVDEVVQIDATHSIASLIQRVGRSGRKEGEQSKLCLYATNKWSLLQSIACWLLYKEGFIEPPQKKENPYDILVHQALSITKGHSGIKLTELINQLKTNASFSNIELNEIEEILNYLVETDLLERLQNEVIIGVSGEKVVNNREFYSVFKVEEAYKVVSSGQKIGEIPFSPQIIEDENILLSAKIWKIVFVDHQSKKIEVIPTKDGKKPFFFNDSNITVNSRIREQMFEILYDNIQYDFLDQASYEEIDIMRKDFAIFCIQNLSTQRPVIINKMTIELYSFIGTRINRTIEFLLNIIGFKISRDNEMSIIIDFNETELRKKKFLLKWNNLPFLLNEIDLHITYALRENPSMLSFSKWGSYLPESYQIELIRNTYFDIEGTKNYLETTQLIFNQ